MNATIRTAILSILASLASASQATLIAWDSFATSSGSSGYYQPAPLQGQNPSVGSGGFSGAWGGLYDTTSAFVATSGSLAHDLTPGVILDGRLKPSENNYGDANRCLSRAIDYAPGDGTYYMSVLLQKSAPSGGDFLIGLAPLESVHWSFSAIQGTYIGIGGVGSTSGSISFLTTNTLDIVVPTQDVHVGETYLALMQFDYSTSGPDSATVTVYDASSAMIANETYTGLNLDGDIGRLGVLTSDLAPTTFADEIRFGTELADVMVVAAPGDINQDGVVDGKDFLIWQRNPSLGSLADWQANYGLSPTADSAAVPEPGTLMGAIITAFLLTARRRR